MRVLITGSRTWGDVHSIKNSLVKIDEENPDVDITLVSGACPLGADKMAEDVATYLGWTIERHEADWIRLGKRAGYVRNAKMVRTGADICLAFIHNDSRGASMTAKLAEKSGIPTEIIKVFG